jgi:hypothetical protein
LYRGPSATYGIKFVTTGIGTSDKDITWQNVTGTVALINPTTQTWTGSHDFGGATLEIPNSASLPGTCTVGMVYMDTDATSGQRIYACEATNSWVLQGGGGSGSGTVTAGAQYSIPYYSAADGGTTLDDIAGLKTNSTGTLLETVKGTIPDSITLRGGTTGGETKGYKIQVYGGVEPTSIFTEILPRLPDGSGGAEPTEGQVKVYGASSSHISQTTWGGPYAGLTSPSFTTSIVTPQVDFGTTGGRFSCASGVCTMAGLGNTYNENIIWNFEANSNQVGVSSGTGVDTINYGSIKLITTGAIQGGMNVIGTFASPITSSGAYTLTAANSYGSMLIYNDTDVVQLVAAVAGMNFCIYEAAATVLTVEPYSSDVIVLNGTVLTAGYNFTLTAATGNYVCMFADAANHWITLGFRGTLAGGS